MLIGLGSYTVYPSFKGQLPVADVVFKRLINYKDGLCIEYLTDELSMFSLIFSIKSKAIL